MVTLELGGVIGDVCQVLVELRISGGLQYHGAHLGVEAFGGGVLVSSCWEIMISVVGGVSQLGGTAVQDSAGMGDVNHVHVLCVQCSSGIVGLSECTCVDAQSISGLLGFTQKHVDLHGCLLVTRLALCPWLWCEVWDRVPRVLLDALLGGNMLLISKHKTKNQNS